MKTTETLELKHNSLLYEKLHGVKLKLSEFSFANLYLFRKAHNYEVLTGCDCVFITGYTNDRARFVLPLCGNEEPDMEYVDSLIKEFEMLYPISEDWLHHFPSEKYDVYHNPDDSDYIYTMEKMATYAGRHLSSKRNLLKQFLETYSWEAEEISEKNAGDAIGIIEAWQKEIKDTSGGTDFESAKEAVMLREALHLYGILYYVDKEPAGYVLGEGITDDTYALHFAKGLTKYKGIYQFMYNHLANKLLDKYKYINFEQDLGLQSLRQAKSSYKPDHMGEKYRVKLK